MNFCLSVISTRHSVPLKIQFSITESTWVLFKVLFSISSLKNAGILLVFPIYFLWVKTLLQHFFVPLSCTLPLVGLFSQFAQYSIQRYFGGKQCLGGGSKNSLSTPSGCTLTLCVSTLFPEKSSVLRKYIKNIVLGSSVH